MNNTKIIHIKTQLKVLSGTQNLCAWSFTLYAKCSCNLIGVIRFKLSMSGKWTTLHYSYKFCILYHPWSDNQRHPGQGSKKLQCYSFKLRCSKFHTWKGISSIKFSMFRILELLL